MSGSARSGAGSAAEEAARLLAAAEQWARTRGSALLDSPSLATGAPECAACPICSAVGALRQVRPEAVHHLLDAAGSLVAALRAAFPPPEPPPSSSVERITLDDPVP